VPRDRLGQVERTSVAAFLGALGAALAGAADVALAWADASPRPGLRGGLRAIAARTGAHAALGGERLLELGGSADATRLSAGTLAAARAWYGAPARGDEDKLARFLDPAGPSRAPLAAIEAFVETLAEDVETREILRLIGAGEGATLEWLTAYRNVTLEPERTESAQV
jgi:hypothetical protein